MSKDWVQDALNTQQSSADYYANEAAMKLLGKKVLSHLLPKIDAAYDGRRAENGALTHRLVSTVNFWTHRPSITFTLRNVGKHDEWDYSNDDCRCVSYEITVLDQQRFVHSVKDALGVEGQKSVSDSSTDALKVTFEIEVLAEKWAVVVEGYTPPTCRKVKIIEPITPKEQPTTREVIKIACTDDEVEKLLAAGGVLVGI